MKRIHKLAAEIFCYSYDNYIDHLGINIRFDSLMPHDAQILETSIKENWPLKKLTQELDVPHETALILRKRAIKAIQIVDAEIPVDSFKLSLKRSIENAMQDGLKSTKDIEKLVTQICYNAADLSVILKDKNHTLDQYSRHLREEYDCDYDDDYFREPFSE